MNIRIVLMGFVLTIVGAVGIALSLTPTQTNVGLIALSAITLIAGLVAFVYGLFAEDRLPEELAPLGPYGARYVTCPNCHHNNPITNDTCDNCQKPLP